MQLSIESGAEGVDAQIVRTWVKANADTIHLGIREALHHVLKKNGDPRSLIAFLDTSKSLVTRALLFRRRALQAGLGDGLHVVTLSDTDTPPTPDSTAVCHFYVGQEHEIWALVEYNVSGEVRHSFDDRND